MCNLTFISSLNKSFFDALYVCCRLTSRRFRNDGIPLDFDISRYSYQNQSQSVIHSQPRTYYQIRGPGTSLDFGEIPIADNAMCLILTWVPPSNTCLEIISPPAQDDPPSHRFALLPQPSIAKSFSLSILPKNSFFSRCRFATTWSSPWQCPIL